VKVAVTEIGKLRAAHASAIAHAKAARADANRLRGLVDKALRPEQDYLDALAAAEGHEAEARGLAAQLSALGFAASTGAVPSSLSLVSPIDGVIVARSAIVGAPVVPDQNLARVVDLSAPWFVGRVFEKDLARVRVGAKSAVVVDAFPGKPFEGVVEALGAQVDPLTRTVMVRIRVTNRDDLLRHGLWGTAHVATEEAPLSPVLVVPRTAVIDVAGRKVAFVRVGDAFEPRQVDLGATSLEQLEVISGLAFDEDVVVQGAFTLKSVMLRSTLAED
jgi:RND family efflux transporter MFP subunit